MIGCWSSDGFITDEELARRLQTEDLMDVIKSQQPTASQKLSLIADEQYARSLMEDQVTSQSKPDLSTKLKQQKLYEIHPGVDKTFLDEVFKNYGSALIALYFCYFFTSSSFFFFI